MTIGQRESEDLARGRQMLSDAMYLRMASVGKRTLAEHLRRVHFVQGAAPLMRWSQDEMENTHEDLHRRMHG